ncbi:hypothetical protein ACP4OV_008209 [Aristida adscensionis]
MSPQPARLPAAKRRGRRRRGRRRSASAADADVPGGEPGSAAPGNAARPSSSSSRRRGRRWRRQRDRAAAAEAVAASTSTNPEATGSDVVSTQGALAPQAGCCLEAVAAHLSVTSPQNITKKVARSNKRRKRNVPAGDKEIEVSAEDCAASSSLARDNSIEEIEALRSNLFMKSDVECPTASGNAGTNIGYQNKVQKYPEMKNTTFSGNSEEVNQKRMSPGCCTLQGSEERMENENGASLNSSNLKEGMKKRKKRRGGKKHRGKKSTSEDPPLSIVTDNPGMMEMVSENNMSGLKPKESRKKRDQNMVPVSADHAGTTEGKSLNLDNAIGKRCELGRSNFGCTNSERNALQEQDTTCISKDHNVSCLSPTSLAEAYMEKLKIVFSPRRSFIAFPKKKLLILDLNGLLADINQDYHNAHMADAKVRGKLVFRRPYCDDFLKFCALNFELGIWSSRKKANVTSVVDILMKDFKSQLLFCWDMSKCTFTGVKTLENMHKPLVLKELRKLWNKEEPDLPWEGGEYSPSNTLLVDDSPYKALRNPQHTAIFPPPFSYLNWNDNSLGPGGDLRVYLQNLASADDVQCYVRNNPFGQPFITESDPHWNFYAPIALKGNAPLSSFA